MLKRPEHRIINGDGMRLTRLILLCFVALGYAPVAISQSNTDGMTLLGMAGFSELNRPYYIAALYSDAPSSDAELILQTNGRRRMEIRVEATRWSPRRFSQQWTQAVLINNDQALLQKFDDNFVQFNSLLDEPFLRGDHIVVDSFVDGSSSVSVNGVKAFDVARPGFLELLLAKWIGARPPSTDFKNSILGGGALALESEFVALQPSADRVAKVQRWFAGSIAGVQQAPAPAAPPKPAPKSPEPKPEAPAAVAVQASETTEPAVAPVAVPESAPAPVPVDSVVAAAPPVVEEEEDEPEIDPAVYAQQQETLTGLYQSSVAKRILRNVKYPKRAVKRDQQASFQVSVVVDRAGNVISAAFVKESRYGLLNDAAMEAITAAGKMPPLPPSLDGESVEVVVPFAFRLE